jgi:predicted ATP-grasp superfamily ATP-dependent carboligase
MPVSAVFLGRRTGADLVGVTRQLVGRPGAAYGYRGSLAPWPVSSQALSRVGAAGDVLAGAFGLVGLFGVDFLLEGDCPWAVEVNPRYTASVEALELALRRPLLAGHRAACEGHPPEPPLPSPAPVVFVAKEVLYATADSIFDPVEDPAPADPGSFAIPEAADLPEPGTRFSAGDPVLTVFARGVTPRVALRALGEARRRWEGRLRPVEPAALPDRHP